MINPKSEIRMKVQCPMSNVRRQKTLDFGLWTLAIVLSLVIISSLVIGNWSLAYACWGWRPMGMGGVFVAVADDANLAYWNRAGSAQLDDWKDGQAQFVMTDTIFDNVGFLNRQERNPNAYYDSFNYAMKINKDWGWSLAGQWSGGGSFVLSPSFGFRLPWAEKMSIGVGYYLWKYEGYDTLQNQTVRADILFHQIHLDYLWRFRPEWSFGIHMERFWQLPATETFPDYPGVSVSSAGSLISDVNFRPAVAWIPEGDLKGLIVNVGIYDMFNKSGHGPYFSTGFEYTPQPEKKTIKEKVMVKAKKKGEKPQVKMVEKVIVEENPLSRSSFRAGIYNYKGDRPSYLTIGYGYKLDKDWDIGYFGMLGITQAAAGAHAHNFGISVKF